MIKNRKEALKNPETGVNQTAQSEGLSYGNVMLGDLVNKDTDSDDVPDWEEGLWGTNPAKRDTDDDGVPDNVEIENLKLTRTTNDTQLNGAQTAANEENLTETDKFSREFFSTITALNQAGAIDQATVDKLSGSLADHIQNAAPKKIFKITDLKVMNDTPQVMENYGTSISDTFAKHTIQVSIADILSESITREGEIDVKVLDQLDPIIIDIKEIVNEMAVMNIPSSFSLLHLDTINGFEKIAENLSDIKLVDSDVIVAVSAISQYEKNDDQLKSSIDKLVSALNKLRN